MPVAASCPASSTSARFAHIVGVAKEWQTDAEIATGQSQKHSDLRFCRRPQRDSNPRCRLERPVSWAARRWGPGSSTSSMVAASRYPRRCPSPRRRRRAGGRAGRRRRRSDRRPGPGAQASRSASTKGAHDSPEGRGRRLRQPRPGHDHARSAAGPGGVGRTGGCPGSTPEEGVELQGPRRPPRPHGPAPRRTPAGCGRLVLQWDRAAARTTAGARPYPEAAGPGPRRRRPGPERRQVGDGEGRAAGHGGDSPRRRTVTARGRRRLRCRRRGRGCRRCARRRRGRRPLPASWPPAAAGGARPCSSTGCRGCRLRHC